MQVIAQSPVSPFGSAPLTLDIVAFLAESGGEAPANDGSPDDASLSVRNDTLSPASGLQIDAPQPQVRACQLPPLSLVIAT
jgi:hypothetical protein